MLSDISQGNTGFADIMFLVAFILFVIVFISHFVATIDARIGGALMAAGLACVALGFLVL